MTVPPPISASSMGVVLPPDRKKRKLADKILAQKVRDLVPESQVKSVFNKSNRTTMRPLGIYLIGIFMYILDVINFLMISGDFSVFFKC